MRIGLEEIKSCLKKDQTDSPICPRYDAKYLFGKNHGEKAVLVVIPICLDGYSRPEPDQHGCNCPSLS